jgi:type II secretory pathway pseudopilin PulG
MSGYVRKRAFTLAELMVAVAVLIVVIVATSQIFGIAGRVTGLGEATANLMQEAATIERQLRDDFKALSDDGFFLIRCVRVRNDINLDNNGGPLLDPNRPKDDFLRADQLFFFVDGAQQMAILGTRGTNIRGLGVSSRVYWGHGIQLALKPAYGDPSGEMRSHDPKIDFNAPLVPWHRGAYDTEWTRYLHNPSDPGAAQGDYTVFASAGEADCTQPPAPSWLLARHAVVMADDGDEYRQRFMYANRTAYQIDDHPVFHGRVDGVSQQLSDIRRLVTRAPTFYNCNTQSTRARPWFDLNYADGDQRSVIAALCGRGEIQYGGANPGQVVSASWPIYTRAERVAPGLQRVDQALTNQVIGTACSSFMIDWTWAPGTGEFRDADGALQEAPGPDGAYEDGDQCVLYDSSSDDICLRGLQINVVPAASGHPDPDVPSFREQPWFGLEEPGRGVYMYQTDQRPWWRWGETLAPDNIEEIVYQDQYVVIYEAIFGYNRGEPVNAVGNPDPVIYTTSDPDCTRVGYTPWPSAIRITATLNDQQQRFGEGREIQFVVDLPRRD